MDDIEVLYQAKLKKYAPEEIDNELRAILYTEAAAEAMYSGYTMRRAHEKHQEEKKQMPAWA